MSSAGSLRRKCFVNARAVTPSGIVDDATVTVVGDVIASVKPGGADAAGAAGTPGVAGTAGAAGAAGAEAAEVIDVGGSYLAPGFVDVHLHGAAGHEFMDASPDGVVAALEWLVTRGVTSCLPTTVTCRRETLRERVKVLSEAGRFAQPGAARVLGMHLEGPFLSPKRPGAMKLEDMRAIDLPEVEDLVRLGQEASGATPEGIRGGIRLMTLAPELPGALELIRWLGAKGVRASAGHSDATYEEVLAAVGAGLDHATHCYNAMRELHHREPGTVGATLTIDGIMAELILDGIHVSPPAAQVLVRCKGTDGVVLISDSVAAAGAGWRGLHRMLDGREVVVDDVSVRLTSGGLAGSLLSLDVAVRNAVRMLGLPVQDAVKMASLNPARSVGVSDRKGSLAPGKDADLVVLNERLEVELTMVMGRVAFSRLTSGRQVG